MRIIQVDCNQLLRHRCLELPRSQVPLLKLDIEAIPILVCAWCWLKLLLGESPYALLLASSCGGLEHTLSSWLRLLDRFRIIVANTWIRLLEVNVHRNWLDIVQWVLLVEGETELAFGVQPGNGDVLLNAFRVILARTDSNGWITL